MVHPLFFWVERVAVPFHFASFLNIVAREYLTLGKKLQISDHTKALK